MTRSRRVLPGMLLVVALLGCSAGTAGPTTDDVASAGSPATAPGQRTRPGGMMPSGTTGVSSTTGKVGAEVERLTVDVLERLPHDPGAFTEGLALVDGALYESTGLQGRSSVRRVDPATGAVLQLHDLPSSVFGEGLAASGDRLVVLTWTSGVAFDLDRTTLRPRSEFRYDGEGWGLCGTGSELIQGDGSNRLTRRDPVTFAVLGTIEVLEAGRPVERLNELECVGDDIYANVWLTTDLVRIDAATGRVTARIDASALQPAGGGAGDVLNGIAYDPRDDTFLLTGKRWDTLYRVRFRA